MNWYLVQRKNTIDCDSEYCNASWIWLTCFFHSSLVISEVSCGEIRLNRVLDINSDSPLWPVTKKKSACHSCCVLWHLFMWVQSSSGSVVLMMCSMRYSSVVNDRLLHWLFCDFPANEKNDGRTSRHLKSGANSSPLFYLSSEQRVRVFGGVCSSVHQSHSQEVHLRESWRQNWRRIRKQCFTGRGRAAAPSLTDVQLRKWNMADEITALVCLRSSPTDAVQVICFWEDCSVVDRERSRFAEAQRHGVDRRRHATVPSR